MAKTTSTVNDKVFPGNIRFCLYLACVAVGIALVIIGFTSEENVRQWLFFAGTLLGIGGPGLSAVNRPRPNSKEK